MLQRFLTAGLAERLLGLVNSEVVQAILSCRKEPQLRCHDVGSEYSTKREDSLKEAIGMALLLLLEQTLVSHATSKAWLLIFQVLAYRTTH